METCVKHTRLEPKPEKNYATRQGKQKKRTWELLWPEQQHRVADAVLRHAGRLGDGAHGENLLRGEHVEGALEARGNVREDHTRLALEPCDTTRHDTTPQKRETKRSKTKQNQRGGRERETDGQSGYW